MLESRWVAGKFLVVLPPEDILLPLSTSIPFKDYINVSSSELLTCARILTTPAQISLSTTLKPCKCCYLSADMAKPLVNHLLHPQQNFPTHNRLPRLTHVHDTRRLQVLHKVEDEAIATLRSHDINRHRQNLRMQCDF